MEPLGQLNCIESLIGIPFAETQQERENTEERVLVTSPPAAPLNFPLLSSQRLIAGPRGLTRAATEYEIGAALLLAAEHD